MECYFLGDILAATDTLNSSSVTVIRTATLRYRLWDNLLGFCNIRKHEFSAVRSGDIADGYDSREVLILKKMGKHPVGCSGLSLKVIKNSETRCEK